MDPEILWGEWTMDLDLKTSHSLKNERGQLLVESVLLITLGVILWSVFMRQAKSSQWFNSLVSGPRENLNGVIETGIWQKASKARASHPNQFYRAKSPSGEAG